MKKSFLFVIFFLLAEGPVFGLSGPVRFSEVLCRETDFYCREISKNENWKTLLPDPAERERVRRLNRMNTSLQPGMNVALPKEMDSPAEDLLSPFLKKIDPPGEKEILVNLNLLAWAAYDENGHLVHWGPAAGGKKWCPDSQRQCRTPAGEYRILWKGGVHCKSKIYPLPSGGAPMPYCMFFAPYYALHGSPQVPGFNASHGCVRLFSEDARWLNENFIQAPDSQNSALGTKIIVLAYQDQKALSSGETLQGDGRLRLFNDHLQELQEIVFKKEGAWLPEGLEKINRLLRSRESSEEISIEPRLLDLVDYLQDHFGADTVEVISGYRTPSLNEELLKTGHAVSPVSLHREGKAIDIHLDEIREEALKNFLLKLKWGGVGYYPGLHFVHIDSGPFRYWEEAPGRRKLVGVLNPEGPVQLTSRKNAYLPGETPVFNWNFAKGLDLKDIEDLKLERFWRGKWIPCQAKAPSETSFRLSPSSIVFPVPEIKDFFGKYRFTFHVKGDESLTSSNEFYLKKE